MAAGLQIAIIKILADLNLAIWYVIVTQHTCTCVLADFNLVVVKVDYQTAKISGYTVCGHVWPGGGGGACTCAYYIQVNIRDLHEHISIAVLQHNIADHHLNLLNGLTSTHTKVTNVSQKPKEEQTTAKRWAGYFNEYMERYILTV